MKLKIYRPGLKTVIPVTVILLVSLIFNNGVVLAKGDAAGTFKATGINKTNNGFTLTTRNAGLTSITDITLNATANDIPVVTVAAIDSTNKNSANYTCDGKGDQIEINAAIASLNSKNGIVRLIAGTYYLTNSILTMPNLVLEGQGQQTVLFLVNNSNCDVITGNYRSYPNVTVQNLTINGNQEQQFLSGAPQNIWLGDGINNKGDNSTFQNLNIENIYCTGIAVIGTNVNINNNTLTNCASDGIALDSGDGSLISNNTLTNCGFRQVPLPLNSGKGSAIAIYQGINMKVVQNTINGGGWVRQIVAGDSNNIEISNNTLVNGLAYGIATPSQFAKIISNSVSYCPGNGIDTWGGNDALIQNNFVSHIGGNVSAGLYDESSGICLNTSDTVCINNTIEFCEDNGIHMGPGNNNNKIIGNTIRDCGWSKAWWASGILLQSYSSGEAIDETTIQGNTIYDDQTTPTQMYGIILSAWPGAISNIEINNNDLRNNGKSGLSIEKINVTNLVTSNNLQ
jgi:parallel beta-helix repeat protein